MKLRSERRSINASSAPVVPRVSPATAPSRATTAAGALGAAADGVDAGREAPHRGLTSFEVQLAPPRPRASSAGRRRLSGSLHGASRHLVVGGATALVVGVLSSATLIVRLDSGSPLPAALRISPAVPPSGGFAVAADDMDETLRVLVDSTTGRRTPSRPAPGGEGVVVDSEGGPVRRVVQSGGVLVDTPDGPALVHVDVRRASTSCDRPVCVQVVRTRAAAGTSPSTLAVVVGAGVEVRAQAWAGTRDLRRAARPTPALSVEALVDLAGDPVWRD